MIKWKRNERKLNINDIKKVIDILPCGWTDGYYECTENYKAILTPHTKGDKLIYAISDEYCLTMYYKCSADGTILEIGYELE